MKKTLTQNGKEYWRSLDQLAETPEFKEFVTREFPEGASEMANPLTRRNFLTLMGASLALAGLASCRRPVEKIIPYVIKPEEIIPGVFQRYATTMPMGLSSYGMVVKSNEGRPTKIEGNEKHPSSLGSTNAFMTAAVLDMYDPDRSCSVMNSGASKEWSDFVQAWRDMHKQYSANQGEGLAVLSATFASPTLARLQNEFKKTFPSAKWVTYEPVSDENIYEGIKVGLGINGAVSSDKSAVQKKGAKTTVPADYQPVYKFENANVILSLDSDFLYGESENITNARGFADGRRIKSEKDSMNRLYVVESAMTVTGGMSDHRLRLQKRQIGAFTAALANELSAKGVSVDVAVTAEADFDKKWVSAVAKDLANSRGKSLVIAGSSQPAEVHALVFAINSALGNLDKTVSYRELKDASLPDRNGFAELVKSMNDGKVTTLAIVGGNPVYNAPSDLDFKSALGKVKTTIHFSPYLDETSTVTTWHVPAAHFLESWGDARSVDGSVSVVQPLIEPLFGSHSSAEFMNVIAKAADERGYDIVRETWKEVLKGKDYEKTWRRVLHDGILDNSSVATAAVKINTKSIADYISTHPFAKGAADKSNLEIVFTPSTSTFDGRFANNGWLQELPNPVTKITWDNVAIMSLATAKEFGLHNNLIKGILHQPMITLQYNGKELEMPVWVQPGQADYSIAVALGYGRELAGRVGNKIGFDTYKLRTQKSPYFDLGLQISKSNNEYVIASVQDHGGLDAELLGDRDKLAGDEIKKRVPTLLRESTLEEYRKEPNFAQDIEGMKDLLDKDGKPYNIINTPAKYDEGYQWGMSIDLNACIGCNACSIACQSENNIPVVGKEQVSKGREMHWIRIDRYYAGSVDQPEMNYQPVACQHCENAPCEQVCPVAATTHDKEGLNVMVYNRCVGTRYCLNNCPYKVRRFNFLEFNPGSSGFLGTEPNEILKMVHNPDVTVRMRGVMEKCTYCTQRISAARIASKKDNREIKDGEVVTACQQSCPTKAIVFGNINDPNSQIVQMKQMNRKYDLLGEINVRPRTSYLAKLRNPNPELETA